VDRPVILITPDIDPAPRSVEDCYRVRSAYAVALESAGAIPLILPYSASALARLPALCDGVLLTGSAPGALQSSARSAFELRLAHAALTAGLPILGICHGMQIIGQVLGATLSDLPTVAATHNPPSGPEHLAHALRICGDSLLSRLAAGRSVSVNSMHLQALTGAGAFRVTAWSADAVIEAIEGHGQAFCLGVQWHPEYGLTDLDHAIFAAFVSACRAQGIGQSLAITEKHTC
jgi:gamma-glutamyl-gamma-aminobutyrate hydrolase PuuD